LMRIKESSDVPSSLFLLKVQNGIPDKQNFHRIPEK